MSSVYITCSKDDFVCYIILIFGLFLFIIAMAIIVKCAYDSTKLPRRGTRGSHIANEQSERVFDVVLNIMNYENRSQNLNTPLGDYTSKLPPTYEECMTFGAVKQDVVNLDKVSSPKIP